MTWLILFFFANVDAQELNFFGSIYLSDLNAEALEEFGSNSDPFGQNLDFLSKSKLGVNLFSKISTRANFHAQLLAEGSSEWRVDVDYSFIDFAVNPKTEIIVGRQIFPIWITSEYTDIGYEQPYTELPVGIRTIFPLKSLTGASLAYRITEDITIKPFLGQETETSQTQNFGVQFDDMVGVLIALEPSHKFKLQISGLTTKVALEADSQVGILDLDVEKMTVFSLSAQYNSAKYLAIFEGGQNTVEASTEHEVNHGAYILLGYRQQDWVFVASPSFISSNGSAPSVSRMFGVHYNFNENYMLKTEVEINSLKINESDFNQSRFSIGVDFVF